MPASRRHASLSGWPRRAGRCNRSEGDRAAYLLWDPAIFSALGNRQGLALLPAGIRDDVFAGVRRSGDPAEALREARDFLEGEESRAPKAPALDKAPAGASAKDEVDGVLSLWGDDFSSAGAKSCWPTSAAPTTTLSQVQ